MTDLRYPWATLLLWIASSIAGPQASAQESKQEFRKLKPPPGISPELRISVDPSRSSATVSVITGQELESLGVRFLTDALRVVPGLEVARMSASESGVALRGYNDDASSTQGILGLVDGRQVNHEFFGAVVWETLPVSLQEIDRIEVIRGPGSFVHGPNAMHGLVNIVTRSPLDYPKEDEVFLSAHAGTYGSNVESFTFVHREEGAGLKVKAGHDDLSEFTPHRGNAKDKMFAEARLALKLDEKDSNLVDLSAGGSSQKFTTLIPPFNIVPTAEFAVEADEPFARATVTYEGLRALVSWTRFDGTAVPDQVFAGFDILLDTADVDLQYTMKVLDQEVTAGTGYRRSSFETDDEDVAGGRHSTGLDWFFIQGRLTFLDPVEITGGVRVDDHSVVGTHVSPRLAAVWTLDPFDGKEDLTGHSLRATAGYGFRYPSLRELWFDMSVFGLPSAITGNEDLHAERLRSFEVGYWGRPLSWLQLETSVYYNRIDGLIHYAPAATGFRPENGDKEAAYGSESQVDLQVAQDVTTFANYAYEVRFDRETHDRIHAGPLHKANAGVRVTPKDSGFTGMLWAHYFDDIGTTDASTGASLGTVDGYALSRSL